MLVANKPQLHLMFTLGDQIQAEELPGFFLVPFDFDPNTLKTFIQANMDKCRTYAAKYLQGQLAFDESLT